MGLPRKNRFGLKKELVLVKEKGKLFQTPLFGLLRYPVSENSETCFAFLISRKIDRRATIRNRIKRVLTEAIRKNLDRIKPGFRVVFLAKKELKDKKMTQVLTQVEKVFQQAELFKSD